jgi:hypothetical protein
MSAASSWRPKPDGAERRAAGSDVWRPTESPGQSARSHDPRSRPDHRRGTRRVGRTPAHRGTQLAPAKFAQVRLVGVMSDVYTGHFALAARQRGCEQGIQCSRAGPVARGGHYAGVTHDAQRDRIISQLQVRLLRANSPADRRRILSQLWDSEQAIGSANPVSSSPLAKGVRLVLGFASRRGARPADRGLWLDAPARTRPATKRSRAGPPRPRTSGGRMG